MEAAPQDQVLTVTELTREIREVLEGHIGTVWVEGEISNHRLQSSGHQYFTLKDSGAQLSCVMFRGAATRSNVRLGDGVQVQVQGEISVYEPRGQYQMVVRQVQLKGQGSLQARFEALKRKLYDEGLFDQERKRPIPKYPRTVALVTSPTGAAIQDMLNILTRRAPWVRVLVYPVRVQGQGVERETIRALQVLNAAARHGLPEPETIVIGRGGGSIEDLWAYNEESLARAIAASDIPVVSAVGHEIDFTIADFVADLRAPTPSAAAELLAPETGELKRQFESMERHLRTRVNGVLEHHARVIELTAKGAFAREPQRILLAAEQLADDLEGRLRSGIRQQWRLMSDTLVEWQQVLSRCHPRLLLADAGHRVENSAHRLTQTLQHRLDRLEDLLRARADLLRNLGPESILSRGFSYTTNAAGKVLKDAGEVQDGDEITTQLLKGVVRSRVEKG
ncbi:MAG TPA: exodeoxyribonuclease VII large subunit [Prosthecobacter sp.]|nr:exodeoxyribonuclease VII large subunit [Prosthecobacter sp.]